MKTKKNNIPTFEKIYKLAPLEIKEYIEKSKSTFQNPKWHPEGNVHLHTKIVYNRAKEYGDINLAIAALFHDLGKVDVTKFHPEKRKWVAYRHDYVSAKLVEKHKNWIKSFDADWEQIYRIVKEHMRIKKIDEMRPFKREKLENDKWFSKYQKFGEFDNMETLTKDELNN